MKQNNTTNDYAASILSSMNIIVAGVARGIASEAIAQGERFDTEAAISKKMEEWRGAGTTFNAQDERGFRWAVSYFIGEGIARRNSVNVERLAG